MIQAWVSSAFPQKFRKLHEINFQNEISCLLRASCVLVFDSLRLKKWCSIRIYEGYFVATYKEISQRHHLLCLFCKGFHVFYFYAHSCLIIIFASVTVFIHWLPKENSQIYRRKHKSWNLRITTFSFHKNLLTNQSYLSNLWFIKSINQISFFWI